MRISWLSPDEIAAARHALTANDASWGSHFVVNHGVSTFVAPPPEPQQYLDWPGITEHVARAERVSEVIRAEGLLEARARFAGTTSAIEAATLAAAAHASDDLALDEVLAVLGCPIDDYVFYAPFLELMIELGRPDVDRTVKSYEQFVAAYARRMAQIPHGAERQGAVRDGLADFYVFAGRTDEAEALFEQRHAEDQNDVAVALSASRAFLAAGAVSRAVRWLGVGAARAEVLGRDAMANRLREKQEAVRKRLS